MRRRGFRPTGQRFASPAFLEKRGGPMRGIKDISKLHNLVGLDVSRNHFTDAAIREPSKLTKVKSLDLEKMDITEAGYEALRGALPKTSLTRVTLDVTLPSAAILTAAAFSLMGDREKKVFLSKAHAIACE
jgi:hypothetical protein